MEDIWVGAPSSIGFPRQHCPGPTGVELWDFVEINLDMFQNKFTTSDSAASSAKIVVLALQRRRQ